MKRNLQNTAFSIVAAGIFCICASTSAQTPQPDRDLVRASGRIRRLALVIGNDAYPGNPLHNAVNDAQSMKSALEGAGFIVRLSLNATQRQMEAVIDEFTGSVLPGDIALFFYAGHGMQISDQNYLVPVDFQARTTVDAKYKAYPAQRVQENLEVAGARMQILILDACRNNPFRSWRGGSDGLAAMQAGKGTYIAFATSPGKTAADNPGGRNGLFTGELITVLRETGLSIDQVFNRVREQVSAKSHGDQLPWSTSSVTGEFYFKLTIEGSISIPSPPRQGERELAFWNSIKDENDPALLEEYLRKYPAGEFASIAKSKLNRLKASSVPRPEVVSPPGPAGPIRLEGNFEAANLIRKVDPIYPQLAKQARIEGMVRLLAVIGRDGSVQSLRVETGHPFLIQAAKDAVMQWLYKPVLKDGEAVEVVTSLDIEFTLSK